MVTHCFIDGDSRYIVGVWVSNNNCAATVLDVFQAAISMHGIPHCVHGNHGTENLGVAAWMEEYKSIGRGSYIWGRCKIMF